MGRRRKSLFKVKLKKDTIHSLAGVTLITLGVLILLSFAGKGSVLSSLNSTLAKMFGIALFYVPFIAIASGLMFFRSKQEWTRPHVLLGALMLMLGTLGLFRAGNVGQSLSSNLEGLISRGGVVAVSLALVISGVLVSTQTSVTQLADRFDKIVAPITKKFGKSKKKDSKNEADEGDRKAFHLPALSLFAKPGEKPAEDFTLPTAADGAGPAVKHPEKPPAPPQLPHLRLEPTTDELHTSVSPAKPTASMWSPPPLELLDKSEGAQADRGDVNKNAQVIESTLESFGIRAKIKQVNYGPSVTQYALEPARGTKLSKILGLSTDLALALAAPTGQVRIEAPIPGQALVGIEVPNYSASYVTMRKMMGFAEMKDNPSKLAVALGIDVAGQPVVMDIAKMPHVLIAGATGSGKSVAINSFLCSILLRASPQEVKLILIDPKRVELTGYDKLPHLSTPIIFESNKAGAALKWAVHEMEDRYKQLQQAGVKNILAYNEIAGFSAMPSILIVVDELADVMLDAPSDVEESITRIAQKARAVGIHLVLATQRPSVDVLTGLIKANIPARIAFNVSSMMDSRVILDTPGAEKLLGKGDMLFIPPDRAKPARIQGTLVTEAEAKKIVQYILNQGIEPEYQEEITSKYKINSKSGGSQDTGDDQDEMYVDVAKFLITQDKASTSMIQRRFKIGYNRAARILDQLYTAGLVGPPDGSKPRVIYPNKLMEVIRAEEGGEMETAPMG